MEMSRGSDNWLGEDYRNGKCIHREDQIIVQIEVLEQKGSITVNHPTEIIRRIMYLPISAGLANRKLYALKIQYCGEKQGSLIK